MNKRQEITDEELEHFKDFDALLVKHRQTISIGSKNRRRWIVLGSAFFAAFIVALYFLSRQEIVPAKSPEPLSVQKETGPVHDEIESNSEQPQSKEPEVTKSTTHKKQPLEKSAAATEQKPMESKPASPIYIQAEPVDGYTKLYEYFNHELIYPEAAVKDSIQGILTVSFIISRDGSVTNIQFTNTLGKPFEEEAIRLIKNMPPWKPATVNGDPVPSKMTLPLTFQIQVNTEKKD